MEIICGNFAYKITESFTETSSKKRYCYTIYKLIPRRERILIGERRSLREAEADARQYLKIAAAALE